jgi:DNA-binding CsgD family transcriptional regulator
VEAFTTDRAVVGVGRRRAREHKCDSGCQEECANSSAPDLEGLGHVKFPQTASRRTAESSCRRSEVNRNYISSRNPCKPRRRRDPGAVPFLSHCDAELSACGLRSPSTSRRDLLELTPAEQTVAHLVGDGLSNREAGERLYVSAKAIEYHLGHIYAKLGITSRRQLIGRLRQPPG